MKITPKLKEEHDKVLEEIRAEMLKVVEQNPPHQNTAKQRLKQFVALGDLVAYIDKYNPDNLDSKAFENMNAKKDIPYNYFETDARILLDNYQNNNKELFEIKGIDLLEQGYLNSYPFQVYGVLQLAQFPGSNQCNPFQEIKSLSNKKYVLFITDEKANAKEKYFDPNIGSTSISIIKNKVSKAIGNNVHIFHRSSSRDRLNYVGEYLILPSYKENPYSNKHYFIEVELVLSKESLTSNDIITDYKENPKNTVSTEIYHRDSKLRDESIERAKGKCENENCKNKMPFLNNSGDVFLESHHITFLSEKGYDTIDNLIALCPNCHREAHHGEHKDKLKQFFSHSIQQKYHSH